MKENINKTFEKELKRLTEKGADKKIKKEIEKVSIQKRAEEIGKEIENFFKEPILIEDEIKTLLNFLKKIKDKKQNIDNLVNNLEAEIKNTKELSNVLKKESASFYLVYQNEIEKIKYILTLIELLKNNDYIDSETKIEDLIHLLNKLQEELIILNLSKKRK
jgi:hypothetical protein